MKNKRNNKHDKHRDVSIKKDKKSICPKCKSNCTYHSDTFGADTCFDCRHIWTNTIDLSVYGIVTNVWL